MEKELSFENLPLAVNLLSIKLEKIENLLPQANKKSIEQPDQLLTIQEASSFLSLSTATIYSKVSKGELPVMKRSKRLYFSRIELLDYLKQGRKKSNYLIEVEAREYVSNRKS